MSKIDLDTISSGYQSTVNLNDNFQSIEDELNNKVLYRDNPNGEPNQMLNDLDMNSNRIINLPTATTNNEPVTYAQWIAAADTALIANTTLSEEQTASSDGQSLFTLTLIAYTPGAKNLTVYRNGVKLPISSYTETSTTSITLSAANAIAVKAGDEFEFLVNERNVDSDTVLASNVTYTPAGSGAATTDVQTKLRESVSVKDFGAVGDGVTDDTAAIQAALTWSTSNRNHSIFFPPGEYVTTSVLTVTQGIKLIGDESQGTTQQYGTTLLVNHNGNGIHYSGTGADFSGTGGGLKHFKVIKGSAYSGGQAVLIDGLDINKRHGEMQFEDVLITANGSASWQRGFYADGTAYTLAGGKGIRSINMSKIRVTDCSEDNEYILLDQVTHYTGTHVQVDAGSGPGAPGMTVQGDSNNVLFANANNNGEMKIGSSTDPINGFVFMGRAASFNNTNSFVDGVVCAQIAGAITNSSNALNIYSSDETYIQELTCNKTSGADAELVKLQNNGTDQAAFGTVSTTVATVKPLVSNGETWIYSVDGTTNERFVQFQYSRIKPNADNVMDNGNASFRWANMYATNVRCTSLLPGGTSAQWTSGSGTPEGAVTAVVGSMYTRTDGGASTTLYVKESGSGNTGWVAK